jgi:N-methylhydantoinase B/oxoprolinase/acetone carboxylase alpha subunit
MKETGALATIQRQIQWNRLIAVVEEQAQTMIRTAFSTTVREAGDLSAGVFDLQGRMLAQAVTGTPGHVNSMPFAVARLSGFSPTLRISLILAVLAWGLKGAAFSKKGSISRS